MATLQFMTPPELAVELGARLRQLRLSRGLDQTEAAERAGVTARTLSDLENGVGGRIDTLLKLLKALDALDGIDALAPQISVDPMQMLRHSTSPRRVRRPRKSRLA
jgi:transcriptional regulator with XRE-family HTH domain